MQKTIYCFNFSPSFELGVKLFGTGMIIGWFREKENTKDLCCLALEDRAGQIFIYPLEVNGEIVKNPIENKQENELIYDDWDINTKTQAINFLEPDGITTSQIINSAIISDKIKDEAVIETKLATDSVTRNKIKDEAVIETKLATDSVTRDKIKNGEVVEAKLATDSVTRDKIKNGEVIKGKLGKGAVLTDNIEDE
jgi:hypothetical protein